MCFTAVGQFSARVFLVPKSSTGSASERLDSLLRYRLDDVLMLPRHFTIPKPNPAKVPHHAQGLSSFAAVARPPNLATVVV